MANLNTMEAEYKNDFEKFLEHTNEKEILLEEIIKETQRANVRTVLDIGAGNGLLAIPLSQKIQNYTAVESNHTFVEMLQAKGIHTAEGFFPTDLGGSFDFILSSHSLSYKEDSYSPFILKVFDLLAPGGIFLIITFRGQEDDWTALLGDIGIRPMDYYRIGYNSVIELLNSLGSVTMRKVTSTVTTETMEDMVQALSFVFSGGKPEKKAQFLEKRAVVEKTLKSKYASEGKYVFPFQHFFIKTIKGSSV